MKRIDPRLAKGGAYAGAVMLLLAVFVLYTRPEFLVALSDQIWACF